ncbi:MAG: DUF4367 domain-containing protein [Hespellia sp.]|nr:DUF4367 domain-containing protein [Hespellia sp.]
MLNLNHLKEEFPEMPNQMREMMEKEVAKQLSEEQQGKTSQRRTYKRSWKKVAVIALAASLALGGTAYAGVKLYQLQMQKEGAYGLKAGVIKTDTADADEKLEVPAEIPVLSIDPQYLPDGMVRPEDGMSKYFYENTPYTGGISIATIAMDENLSADQLPLVDTNVIASEGISVNGQDGIYLEKDIIAENQNSFNKKIYIAYPEYWQILEIFIGEDVSKDEAIKIAENLKVTGTQEMQKVSDIGSWSTLLKQDGDPLEGMGEKQTVTAQEMKNLHKIGDTFPMETVAATDTTDWLETECIDATVTDVQILDNISILDPAYAGDSEITSQIDAEGNLISNKIYYLKTGDGINNLDNIVRTEEIPQKLVYVTIELKNTSETELKDVIYFGTFNRAVEKDGVYTFYDRAKEDGDDQTNAISYEGSSPLGEMVYYDIHGGTRNNNYITSLMPQESVTLHIAGIVNEDELDKMYLNLSTSGGTTSFTEEALKMGYVDIRQ